VHHDESIAGQAIPASSFSQLRAHRLPNGEPIPTLAEALDVIAPMIAFVEVKTLNGSFDEALLAAFDGAPDPSKIAVHSFDHRIVKRLGSRRHDLARGVLSASYPIDAPRMMRDAGATALWQHASLVDGALVRLVHDAGGVVYPWTVDQPDDMRRLLAEGVDGLCSNHPDKARRAVDSPVS
jgi:glycerophosphoryl diester phosphodiesterase